MTYVLLVLKDAHVVPVTIEEKDYAEATDESLGKVLRLTITRLDEQL